MLQGRVFVHDRNGTAARRDIDCNTKVSGWASSQQLEQNQLIGYVDGSGCTTAATYIRRAKIGMFGYIRRWLKWGLISPRASSMVERVMRELGRRLKKTAYGWSDKGATKIARIILKRFTNAKAWEDYWQEK